MHADAAGAASDAQLSVGAAACAMDIDAEDAQVFCCRCSGGVDCACSEPTSPASSLDLTFRSHATAATGASAGSFSTRRSSSSVRETSTRRLGEDDGGFTTVNQFSVLDCIGMGSFSKVYLAIDNDTEKLCAVKILRKAVLRKKGLLDRFRREVDLYKQLEHEHVLQLLEVIDDEGGDDMYLVYEYMSRGELLPLNNEGVAANGALSECDAGKALRDVVLGLSFLHENHVCHCDVKPANLLVTGDRRVKIADLGSAVDFGAADGCSMTRVDGTPAFLAPEVVEGVPGRTFDARAVDVWALGVTLHTMLYGHLPFHGPSRKDTARAILDAAPAIPPHAQHTPAADLVRRMLEKDPACRITLDAVRSHPFYLSAQRAAAAAAGEPAEA